MTRAARPARRLSPRLRRLTVDGRVYGWRYGGGSRVTLRREDDGRGWHPTVEEITGWDLASVERGQWKRYFSLKPSVVASYVRRVIHGEPAPSPRYADSLPDRDYGPLLFPTPVQEHA